MNIWTRLGISVALSAGFYILMAEVVQRTRHFEAHKWLWIWGLLGGGFLIWLLGLLSNRRPSLPGASASEPGDPVGGESRVEAPPPAEPGFLSLPYCGCMLMVFGLITVMVTPASRTRFMATARSMTARSAPAVRRANSSPGTPRTLPQLRLQGIIFKQTAPSCIINGKSLFLGESVSGVKVVDITLSKVTVQFGDAQHELAVR
jgi:hypothetical protein